MNILYGIKNCDTVKKARRWMDDNQVNYRFHDFRVDGLSESNIKAWVDELGWETLVNKRSTTWKALDETTRQQCNRDVVIPLILESPTLIKRPLLDTGSQRYVGFKPVDYHNIFNTKN